MNNQARFDFYEKLYFHEIEAREQMTTRLQIPLAMLIAVIGVMGFMVQNLDRDQLGNWTVAFQINFGIAAALILISAGYCIKSAWGYNYDFISFASQWHDYHQQCITLYASQPAKKRAALIEGALQKCIRDKYIDCATVNAAINEKRSYRYHLTIKYFIVAVVFVSTTFACYFFGGLDKSLRTKPLEVNIVSSIPLKGVEMAAHPPAPPPPPPPPTRHVRDDRRPSAPPPRSPNGK
ncbi:hypothetical protein [Janthinobacterium lividum]|uniref:hypothetical protein n=1 Tax=Janthinobacterium lividum TaxID=29581 RepID=UPI00126A5B47|nr:hypothetical protein [Janthinobacterium lividum]